MMLSAKRLTYKVSLRIALITLAALLLPLPKAGTDAFAAERTISKLAEGVYLIRHKNAPDHFTQSNTVVVIGDAGVLVVDSCYLPSSAREDIAQIRQWTNKPVRYLVNTHWHGDHTQGNAAYAEAFPSISIIAQVETAKLIATRVAAYLSEYPTRMERFQRELDTGKDPGGRLLSDAQKEDLKIAVSGGKRAGKRAPRLPERRRSETASCRSSTRSKSIA